MAAQSFSLTFLLSVQKTIFRQSFRPYFFLSNSGLAKGALTEHRICLGGARAKKKKEGGQESKTLALTDTVGAQKIIIAGKDTQYFGQIYIIFVLSYAYGIQQCV